MNQPQDFSLNQITSLQKSLYQKARQLADSIEQKRDKEDAALKSAKRESILLLENNLQSVASDHLDNANLFEILKLNAVQQSDNWREAATQRFQKAKSEADSLARFFSSLDKNQNDLVSQWSRVNYSSLDISKENMLSNTRPNSLEEYRNLAIKKMAEMAALGDPSQYGSGELGRSGLGVIGDIFTGSFVAIGGVIYLLVIGGIPALIVSAIVAFVVSFLLDVEFTSVLLILLGIILFIGVLLGLGGFSSDEDKAKKLAQRQNLQAGCKAYLVFQMIKDEMPAKRKERINILESQKVDQHKQVNEALQAMQSSIEVFELAFSRVVITHQQNMQQIEFDNTEREKGLYAEAVNIQSRLPLTLAVRAWESIDPDDPREILEELQQNTRREPGTIRVGRAEYPANVQPVDSPMLVDISECGHIFILSTQNTQKQADEILQSIVARLVFSTPVMSAKYIFIDPKASGMFSMYHNLPERMGNYDYSSQGEINNQVQGLESHKKQIQAKIGTKSIAEYNQEALVPEMYRFLCISGFPNAGRIDPKNLENLIEKSSEVGIHIIMQINLDNDEEISRLPKFLQIDQLSQHGAVIRPHRFEWELQIDDKEAFPFYPDRAPEHELLNSLIPIIKKLGSEIDEPTFSFAKISPPPAQWWTKKSKPILDVQFGYAGEKQLRFRLGSEGTNNFVHALVAGQSGSGKSVFFHTLINNIALNYSPEEVELYLLDFKQGVEFKPYADFQLPHARVIAIESEPEFGLSILNNLWSEHERRAKIGCSKFEDYNDSKLPRKLPRIVVIFDEYQMLFDTTALGPQLVGRLIQVLENLARQGRSSGIHLVLGSQSRVGDVNKTTYDQFNTRILLQSSQELAQDILEVDRSKDLTHAGQVIYNEKKGIGAEKDPVGQVAMITHEEVIQNVQRLKQYSALKGFKASSPTVVFRGDQPSSFSANKHAIQLYGMDQWLTPPQVKQFIGFKDWAASEHPALAWLGEPIEIKAHTAAVFRRRGRSNLLIVGSQEETIFGMLSSCLLSLPLFYKPNDVQFLIADLSLKDEEWADTCEHFRDAFVNYDIKVEERGAAKIIERAHQIMLKRKQAQEDNRVENVPSIFLLVAGLQRVSQLKPVISDFNDLQKSPLAVQLLEILDAGPELGIHSILWADNPRNFDKILNRSALNHFSQRVTLYLSENESLFLLDNVAAANLKGYRALLFDEDAEQPLEKFKPYAMPHSNAERARLIKVFGQRLNSR